MKNEKKYAKIIVKSNYETKNDLVFRPLVRAYEEIGAETLLEDGNAIILGTIDENGLFQELFTKKEIPFGSYVIINQIEVWYKIAPLTTELNKKIQGIIRKVVFNENISLNVTISTMEDLASDRRIEFDAYNHSLSNCNPYSEPYDGYNDFGFKLTKIR